MERRNTGEKMKENEDLCLSFGFSPLKRSPTFLRDFYGVGMRKFPFTTEQWQELQRQAMIYKYMVASVPIPPHLLFPSAAKSFPETPAAIYLPPSSSSSMISGGGINLMRLANNSTDPEPGRCRRTDGKKWRCARDAAPAQKYCERHLNRGRPRSRKPVEHRRTRVTTIADSAMFKSSESDIVPFRSVDSNEEPSTCKIWMKSYPENLTPKERLEIVDSKIGLKYNTNPELPHYEELPNLNYSETCSWYPFLNSNLSSLEESNVADYNEPPRRFFDAWSSENNKQPLSTLTLSISNAIEEGTEQIHNDIKSHQLSWMASNSPLGGPLAEVLHSSNITSQESSPRDSPSRLVSSPTGVLQKPHVSLSDSSSSSSPTLAAASRPDFALQWMNLNN